MEDRCTTDQGCGVLFRANDVGSIREVAHVEVEFALASFLHCGVYNRGYDLPLSAHELEGEYATLCRDVVYGQLFIRGAWENREGATIDVEDAFCVLLIHRWIAEDL